MDIKQECSEILDKKIKDKTATVEIYNECATENGFQNCVQIMENFCIDGRMNASSAYSQLESFMREL